MHSLFKVINEVQLCPDYISKSSFLSRRQQKEIEGDRLRVFPVFGQGDFICTESQTPLERKNRARFIDKNV